MSKNKFDNFFNDPSSIIKDEKFQPTFEQKIHGLMLLVSKRPDWYCDPAIRLILVTIVADVNSELAAIMKRGEEPCVWRCVHDAPQRHDPPDAGVRL